jgi:hypothetical protein
MALIIDLNQLRELKEYAETHLFTLEELYSIQRGEYSAAGNREKHRVFFPVAYKIVFSIDQSLTRRWVRHMSMSTSEPGKIPSEIALRQVCEHLGFKDFDGCLIQKEIFHENAIEVMEYIDDTIPNSNE